MDEDFVGPIGSDEQICLVEGGAQKNRWEIQVSGGLGVVRVNKLTGQLSHNCECIPVLWL